MFSLEQVKLLESKITRMVNFITRVTEENNRLKKRNDELEEAMVTLREEKTRMEEGINSALGKLNQFEDAIEQSLSFAKANQKPVQKESPSPVKVSAGLPPDNSTVKEKPGPVYSAERTGVSEGSPPDVQPMPVSAPTPPVPAVTAKPPVPSAYTIDESDEEEVPAYSAEPEGRGSPPVCSAERTVVNEGSPPDEIEDSGEAELDIF
jgi:hypothetical protein